MNTLSVNRKHYSDINFTAFRAKEGLFKSKRRANIAKEIIKKLECTDPKSGKSYVQRAENNGHHICLTKSKNGKGVRVDSVFFNLRSDNTEKLSQIGDDTLVGEYSKLGQFTTEQFDKVSKPSEDIVKAGLIGNTIIFFSLLAVLPFVIYDYFHHTVKFIEKNHNKIEHVTKNDSFKPLAKDTLDLSKRIIKK